MPISREFRDLLRLLARGIPDEPPPLTELPPISEAQQEMRQHATITIAHLLQGLGQGAWVPIILGWLNRFDGLEALLYPKDDPFATTAADLGALVQRRAAEKIATPVSSEEMAALLVSQHFCAHLRVRAGFEPNDREWDSTKETFREFLESIKPTIVPNVWEVNYSTPIAAEHRRRLIVELDQHRYP